MADIFDELEQQRLGVRRPTTTTPEETIGGQEVGGGDIFDQIEAQQAPVDIPQQQLPEQPEEGLDFRSMVRPTLEAVGSMGMGVAGGFFAGPPGAVAGGALGYAAGREIADIVLGEQTDTLGEELLEAGENIYEGLQLEALGLVGGKLLTPIGRTLFRGGKLAKKGSQAAMNQIRRLKAAQKLDVPVTLGEAVDSQALLGPEDFFRDLAVPRFIPGAKFQKFDEAGFKSLLKARSSLVKKASKRLDPADIPRIEDLGRQISNKLDNLFAGKVNAKGAVMDKLRNEALEHYGSAESFESLNRTGQEILEAKQLEFEDLANQWFNKAANELPAGGEDAVGTNRILKAINRALKEADNLAVNEREPVVAALNKMRGDYITEIPGTAPSGILTAEGVQLPGTPATQQPVISYNKLINRRHGLGAQIRGLETPVGIPGEAAVVTGGKKISRIFKPIQKALDDDLAGFARTTGTEVDRFVKNGLSIAKRKFDFVKNPAIKQLMRSRPEQFLDVLLKPNQIDTIKLLQKELKPEELMPLKQVAINDLLGGNTDEILTATALKKNIKRAGEGTLRTLFGADDFNQMLDLQRKLMSHERGLARMQMSGITPKQLGLRDTDLMSNKYFKQLVRNQKPEKILNLIYRKGNTTNVKKTYAALRAAGDFQKVQDLKAKLIEEALPVDPKTGFVDLKAAHKNIKDLGDDVLRASLSESEYKGFREISDTIELIERRKPGGANISVFREVFEPVAAPMAWAYLRADGRNQLKKVLRLTLSEATREAKNKALTKLIAIGTRAMEQSQRKEDQRNGLQR
jgi:hypothetical protein